MIIIKSDSDLEKMRASGRVAGQIRDLVAARVGLGVSTMELSEYAGKLMKQFGAESAFLGYRGYPGQICVSVNCEVVHGIPGPRVIKVGDIVSIDVGIRYHGFIGDTATTVMVGVADERVIGLVKTTERALMAGLAEARVGRRLSDISHAIETVATRAGFSVVRNYVGHGIGRAMHEDPQIPNFGSPGRGPKLKPGMTLAIEPMINLGTADVDVDEDGWTVRTKDRKPSAHFEHTIAVTEGDAEILTCG
jgi:methionyl aminopeptidase